jgi:hypothetical protein
MDLGLFAEISILVSVQKVKHADVKMRKKLSDFTVDSKLRISPDHD